MDLVNNIESNPPEGFIVTYTNGDTCENSDVAEENF